MKNQLKTIFLLTALSAVLVAVGGALVHGENQPIREEVRAEVHEQRERGEAVEVARPERARGRSIAEVYEIPITVSLAVVAALLGGSTVASLLRPGKTHGRVHVPHARPPIARANKSAGVKA